jgi:hypothetical protein
MVVMLPLTIPGWDGQLPLLLHANSFPLAIGTVPPPAGSVPLKMKRNATSVPWKSLVKSLFERLMPVVPGLKKAKENGFCPFELDAIDFEATSQTGGRAAVTGSNRKNPWMASPLAAVTSCRYQVKSFA